MTPKEKAKELVEKIYEEIAYYPEKSLCYFEWNNAKDTALIAVDEIINSVANEHVSDIYDKYWNKVKKEIKKV